MKTPKEFERDLTQELLFPTLSWSSISSWEYSSKYNDRRSWYKSYVLGERFEPNATMKAGIDIGQKLVTHSKFLPEVPRPEIYEYSTTQKLGKITVRGHMDGWTPSKLDLLEYKTTTNDKRWTQKAVDEWGQITFYCMLHWLENKIKPEDISIRLVVIPTEQKEEKVVLSKTKQIKIFTTKRTMSDIIKFMSYIKKVHEEMTEYVDNLQ